MFLLLLLSASLTLVTCQLQRPPPINNVIIPTLQVTPTARPRLPTTIPTLRPLPPVLVGHLQIVGGLSDGQFVECIYTCIPTQNNVRPGYPVTYDPATQYLLNYHGHVCNQDGASAGNAQTLYFDPLEDLKRHNYTAMEFKLHNGVVLTMDPNPQKSNGGNTAIVVGTPHLAAHHPLSNNYGQLTFVPALRIVPLRG
ncbi:hypothetical protein Dda_5001 [Drechslerella dactyloides]|uniref:Uncharacterized protein n=1 Tax=Drechslerella dactyloides TaxID=74499 RepID=A0AAD6J2E4_DREDA|nr:hypothetical protein Dda_5001 [Drechslerella dactyloides]